MSNPNPSGSYQVAKGQFKRRLRDAMTRQGHDQTTLAKALGISRSTVCSWACGRTIPEGEMPARLAKVLEADDLAGLAMAARTRTCAWCWGTYQASSRLSATRFCSPDCRVRWWHVEKSRRAGKRREEDIVQLRNEVERLRHERRDLTVAIHEMCRLCEWDGICKDASCPIQKRGVSPFQVAERQVKTS
jgi:transcriptional regulator with XRE-family HTH domain